MQLKQFPYQSSGEPLSAKARIPAGACKYKPPRKMRQSPQLRKRPHPDEAAP